MKKSKANAVIRRSARQRMMGGASGAGLVVAAALVSAAALATGPEKAAPTRTVRLIVDYGDGVEKHFTALAFRDGMTVLDAVKAAKASPHGIAFVHRGQGPTALLTQIDDLKNQGGGRSKRNWLFKVNGKLATVGFGGYRLKPADVIRWTFGVYERR